MDLSDRNICYDDFIGECFRFFSCSVAMFNSTTQIHDAHFGNGRIFYDLKIISGRKYIKYVWFGLRLRADLILGHDLADDPLWN